MHLQIVFARRYPRESLLTLLALMLGGVAEGMSLTTLLPLFDTTLGSDAGAADAAGSESGATLARVLATVGLSPTIGTLLTLIMVGLSLKAFFLLIANRQVGYTVAFVATDLRLGLFRALLGSKWSYFVHQPTGALANSVATEATRASEAYLHGANMAAMLIHVLVFTIASLLISWQATLVALGAAAVLLPALSGLVRKARKAGRRQTGTLRDLISHLTDSLGAVKPLKAMGRGHTAGALLQSETRTLNKALRKQVFSKQALKALQEPLMGAVICGGLYVALVPYGMKLSEVLVLTLLMARVLSQLNKLQQRYQDMMVCESAYWSLQRTAEAAEAAAEHFTGDKRVDLHEGLRFAKVDFGYDGNPVLQGVDLFVPAGALSVFTGPSGGGKTTLLDLIIGLVLPDRGQVLVDGVPISDLDIQAWRCEIGYVPQDAFLLNDSVFFNIGLGDPTISEDDAWRALEQAGVAEVVRGLSHGIHTIVGERGGRFSGGQRQRIALARALVHRPRLLLLDEATSALDADTERQVCDTLRRLRGEITIIAVAHQSRLVDVADRVYRVENGRVRLLAPSGDPATSADPAAPMAATE